jgi:hypothetical protein
MGDRTVGEIEDLQEASSFFRAKKCDLGGMTAVSYRSGTVAGTCLQFVLEVAKIGADFDLSAERAHGNCTSVEDRPVGLVSPKEIGKVVTVRPCLPGA